LLAEVTFQIQRTFAKTANNRSRVGDRLGKRLPQSFLVNL
jgi:hypothetical protein